MRVQLVALRLIGNVSTATSASQSIDEQRSDVGQRRHEEKIEPDVDETESTCQPGADQRGGRNGRDVIGQYQRCDHSEYVTKPACIIRPSTWWVHLTPIGGIRAAEGGRQTCRRFASAQMPCLAVTSPRRDDSCRYRAERARSTRSSSERPARQICSVETGIGMRGITADVVGTGSDRRDGWNCAQ